MGFPLCGLGGIALRLSSLKTIDVPISGLLVSQSNDWGFLAGGGLASFPWWYAKGFGVIRFEVPSVATTVLKMLKKSSDAGTQ